MPASADLSNGQYDAICQFDGAVYPIDCLIDSNGNSILYTDARTPDWTIALDEECMGEVRHYTAQFEFAQHLQ